MPQSESKRFCHCASLANSTMTGLLSVSPPSARAVHSQESYQSPFIGVPCDWGTSIGPISPDVCTRGRRIFVSAETLEHTHLRRGTCAWLNLAGDPLKIFVIPKRGGRKIITIHHGGGPWQDGCIVPDLEIRPRMAPSLRCQPAVGTRVTGAVFPSNP